jgi:hypothetical protein
MYDVFARSFKRFRVVITIDFRLSAKRKSRVDVQNRASSKIAFDSNFVEKKKKKVKKKERDEKIAKEKKNEENEEKEKRMKMTKLTMMTKETTTSTFKSCRSLSINNLKFRFLSSLTNDRLVSSRSK